MKVVLYKVGRNLSRAYRTCDAFGVNHILLFDCKPDAEHIMVGGNLFKAKNRVTLSRIDAWPEPDGLLLLETNCPAPIQEVNWAQVEYLVIGGETSGLPVARIEAAQKARIPMFGEISSLTVEAALAIALYERTRNAY